MHPEQRFFPLQQQTTTETAIRTNLLADLYVALGDPDGKGGWTVRAYYKPLVPWIWIGAVIMAFGGAGQPQRPALARRRAARAAPPGPRPAAGAAGS